MSLNAGDTSANDRPIWCPHSRAGSSYSHYSAAGNAAFIIRQAQWCTLDYLTIHTIAGTTSGPAIRVSNSVGTTIERILLVHPAKVTDQQSGTYSNWFSVADQNPG